MRLLRYVYANVLRKPWRTLLTVLSIGSSLLLLIALATVMNLLFNPTQNDVSVRRLAVRCKTSLAEQMPLAYGPKIAQIPHAEMVMPFQWFGGYYRDERNHLGTLAGDPEQFFKMFPELKASPETVKAFQTDRRGAVIGRLLMDHYGWKVGDTITVKGDIFPVDLELHIVGSYTNPDQENGVYIRWDYLKEALGDNGKIGAFWVLADDKDNVPGIIDKVDAMFDNSPVQTKTETEKTFMLGFVSMLGNVKLVIGSVSVVVVFTMLLVAASTMGMTIRERMREVAILKAIGFPRFKVLYLILMEGVALAMLGWAVAFATAIGLHYLDWNTLTVGFIPKFQPPLAIYFETFAVGLVIGLVAGLIPGWQASRLTISEAMRKLE